jgi:(R)-benzylsuccinyl-CoA dehydrogenase
VTDNQPAAVDASTLAALRDVVSGFVQRELLPLERTVQRREAERGLGAEPLIPADAHERLLKESAALDLWGLDVPQELGGQGLGMVAKMIAVEELNRSIVPFRLPPESPNLFFLNEACVGDQIEEYLMPYARGEKRASLALTEPGAGSDAGAIQTVAERRSGGWSLRGTKRFISWADTADFFIVIALTDREKRARGGMTAFLVDRAAPGLEIGPHAATMGEPTPYDLMLDDCFVPDELILGQVDNAFGLLTKRLGLRRVEMGARSIGMGERLVEMMVSYAHDRSTFGSPLADRQIVQSWIADSVIDIHATRLMVRDAAEKIDAGTGGHRLEASAVKVFGTEMISRISDRAVQLYGGAGLTKELPIEYIYRNSRFMRIMEGPSEIHRVQIAKQRLRGPR